jgi:hypothetical protein
MDALQAGTAILLAAEICVRDLPKPTSAQRRAALRFELLW